MKRDASKTQEFTYKPEALKYGPGTIKKVLRFGRSYSIPIIFLLFLVICDAAVSLINPLIYRKLINTGILKGNSRLVVELAALAGCVAIADTLFTFLQKRWAAKVGLRISLDLSRMVFNHMQKMPLAFFVRARTGAIVHRLNDDISNVSDAFINIVSMAVSNFITVSLVLTAMFVLSWKITAVSLILVPIFLTAARTISYRLRILTRERYRRAAEKNHFTIERFNVGGALVTKIFGRPEEELEDFIQISAKLRDTRLKATTYSSALSAGLGLTAAAAVASLYGWGGTMAIHGRLDVGTLVALVSYLLRLSNPLTALGNLQVDVLAALISFERIFEILELEPLIKEKPRAVPIPPGPAKIEFQTVSFHHPAPALVSRASFESIAVLSESPGRQVLSEISFAAEPGQLVALVGLSGSGKTTVAQLTARLYDPVSGSVKINGCDLRDATMDSIRATVGMVTQDAHFFHDTVRANLLYAKPDASEAQLIDALRKAQILPVIEALPQGLDTVIGDRGHRISGGEKQRLAIARVLLKSPRVIILDEATAHLDSASEQAIQIAFQAALAGRTSLVIAHRLSTVRNADCIIVLEQGRIIERGRHEELLGLRGMYYHLYRTQFKDG